MTVVDGGTALLPARGRHLVAPVDGPFRRATAWALLLSTSTIGWQDAVSLPVPAVAKVTGVVAGLLGVVAILVEGRRPRLNDVHFLSVALAALVTLSSFWTLDLARTLDSMVGIVLLVGLVLLTWEFLPGRRGALRLATAYWIGTAVPALMLVWRNLSGTGVVLDGRQRLGTVHPNDVAFMLCLAIPLAWYVGWRRRGWWLAAASAFVPLALYAIVLTASRSGLLIGLLAATVVPWTALAGRPRRAAAAGAVLLIVGPLFIPLLPAAQIARLATTSSALSTGDLNDRGTLWAAAWDTIGDHPLAGVGAGASRVAIEERTDILLGAHNTFLSVAAELGIIGLALFLLILMCLGARIGVLPASLERRTLVVLAAVILIGLQVRHWEYEKALWAAFAFILATTEPDDAPEEQP